MAMNVVYPVFIKRVEKDYLVYIPDMEIYTEGNGFAEAIASARDVIGLKAVDYLEDGKELPQASDGKRAIEKAREDADEGFDYSDGVLTFVDVDCEDYRNWLSMEAVTLSETLQEKLKQKLNIE